MLLAKAAHAAHAWQGQNEGVAPAAWAADEPPADMARCLELVDAERPLILCACCCW